jgi:plastocyanin
MLSTRLAGSAILIATISFWGCGSSGSGGYNPSPSPNPTPNPPAAGTVDIVGTAGSQSFNPNPASLAADSTVTFQNNNNTAHHIIANDGSFDTGVLAPGAASAKMPIAAAGSNFHCSIHPSMIGAIKGTNGAAPPCQGQYCVQASVRQ